jgi:hypothetical protein
MGKKKRKRPSISKGKTEGSERKISAEGGGGPSPPGASPATRSLALLEISSPDRRGPRPTWPASPPLPSPPEISPLPPLSFLSPFPFPCPCQPERDSTASSPPRPPPLPPFLTALRTRPAAGRAEFRSLAGQEAIFGAFWADPGREGTEFPRPRPPAAPLLGSPCARRAYQGESGDLSSGPASWSPWRRYAIVSSLSLLHLILPCRLPVLKIVF